MKQCLNCYGHRCNERCAPPEMTTNFWHYSHELDKLAEFLSTVITDCKVCPVNEFCKGKQECKTNLKKRLNSKSLTIFKK